MPRVVNWILDTGETVILPDLDVTAESSSSGPATTFDDVRGLMAVPIVVDEQPVVGAICVFDVKPLRFSDMDVKALKALGRRARIQPPRDRIDRSPDTAAAPATVHGATRIATRRGDSVETVSAEASSTLLDRASGDLAIARELTRIRREKSELSIILLDVDPHRGSKQEIPEQPIPEVLVETAGETLSRAVRGSDLSIQWGERELLVVLPGLGLTEARPVAERVRAAIHAGARHHAAVSGGVAALRADDTFESLVARADERLRLAREHGHNRVA